MAATHSLDLERSSSQFASILDSLQTGLSITGDITVECWVRFESLPSGGGLFTFVSQDDYAVSRGYYFGLFDDSGTLKLRLGVYVGGAMRFPMVAFTPTTGVWYHLAVTRASSSGDTKFYVNGGQQGSTQSSTSGAIQDSTVSFRLGAVGDTGSAANFHDGLIKEVRVWSSVRTSTEIPANAGKEIGTNANLKGYWKLNNDYADASGNSNTLTASGSPVFTTTIPWENAADVRGSTYLETNLRAYHDLESNANDRTSNGFNLTTAGTPSFGSGKVNNGMDLGSSNSTKKATIANDIGITGGACSISLWVKVNTAPSSGNYQDIAYQMDDGTDVTNRIYYWNDAGTLKLTFGRDKLGSGGNEVTITKTLTVGTWYHLVYAYDGTNIYAYIDGVLVGILAASGSGASGGSDFWGLGVNAGGSSNWASVMLDEVAVYSRGLHYGDVLDLYKEGTGITWSVITTTSATIQAKARMKVSGNDKTVQAKARVKVLGNDKTVTARARIKQAANTQTITARAKIAFTVESTVQARARVKVGQTQTVQAKARVFYPAVEKTVTAKARIKFVHEATITARARIAFLQTKTIQAKARIWSAQIGVIQGNRSTTGIMHGRRALKNG